MNPVEDIGYRKPPTAPADMDGCFGQVAIFDGLSPERKALYQKQAEVNAARGCPLCRHALAGTGDFADFPEHSRKAHLILCADPDSDYNRETSPT